MSAMNGRPASVDESVSAIVVSSLPLPIPPPGPMQNADAFCMGTRPLRFAAGEGAERREIGRRLVCRHCFCIAIHPK